jgi:hypothetical protein
LVFNSYSIGQDNLNCQTEQQRGSPGTRHALSTAKRRQPQCAAGSYVGAGPPVNWSNVTRVHEDDSILVKYYDAHGKGGAGVSKMAFSLTVDIGCEYGGGVSCSNGKNKESFLRHDALRPHLVQQRSIRGDGRRRLHEQSGPLSGP